MGTITTSQTIRIANKVRIFIAAIQRYANTVTNFGRAIIDILKKQYPDQNIDVIPGQVGHKMLNIAKRELQRSPEDAMDLVQEFLTYLTTGTDTPREIMDKETGEIKKEAIKGEPWNFRKDFDKWEDALKAIYSNLRRRGISRSRVKFTKEKVQALDAEGKPKFDVDGNPIMVESQKHKQKSLDEAFGKRTEGGPREKGEERIPTPQDASLGQALDDKTAIKEFLDVIDEFIPDLKSGLDLAERSMFELIFDDGIGSFSSDVKANMGQATSLKEKIIAIANLANEDSSKAQDILNRYGKRWSGFVTDTRKKLLDKIEQYVEYNLTSKEINTLWDMFHSDVLPKTFKSEKKASIMAIAYRIAFL
jgi:hypothetical protein